MHCFAVGQSRSGKTTLVKALAAQLRKSPEVNGVLVYDPMTGAWDADLVTRNFRELVETAEKNTSCVVIVDECLTVVDKEEKRMLNNLLTVGRHYGHSVILIAQRFSLVPPTARNQCERLFVFKQSPRDADAIYDDYSHDLVKELPKFQRGEYLDMTTFDCEKRKIF